AGEQKGFATVDALAEVRHQVPERSRLPPLVQRLEAFRHTVRGRRDLVRIDGVELLLSARDLEVPENQGATPDHSCHALFILPPWQRCTSPMATRGGSRGRNAVIMRR